MQTPYPLQVVQPLRELFLQDKFSEIPDIHLNPNSDLSLISSNVSSLSLSLMTNQSENEQITQIFNTISEYMQDQRNLLRFQAIDQTAKAFAATLENSYTTLTTIIIPTIDRLREKIEARFHVLMTRERAEDLLPKGSQLEPSESDYTFLEWEGLTSPTRQTEIIEMACSLANISNPSLSPLNLAYILKKANLNEKLVQISVPENVAISILTKLNEVFVKESTGITESLIQMIWGIVTDKSRYQMFFSDTLRQINDVKSTPNACLYLASLTNTFAKVLQDINAIVADDLGIETKENLASNVDAVMKTIYAFQYWLIMMKESKFADKLILTPTIINGPVYSDFVREGYGIGTIHNYLKVFHQTTTVPLEGIRLSTVMTTDITSKLEQAHQKLKMNEVFITSKCLFAAYDNVLNTSETHDILTLTFPTFEDDTVKKLFQSTVKARSIGLAGDIVNLDKVLYDIIISVFYKNTLVATLYKYLGKSFADLTAASDDDINEQDINEAQCFSVAELLVDHIFSTLVVTE